MNPSPSTAFAELVAGSDGNVDVVRGALLIAAHARAGLDVREEEDRLADLAAACPEPTVSGLRRHLFDEMGFGRVPAPFDDPRSSFLDHVVATRSGLPIALSVLTVAIGRHLGLDLHGVGLPAHFVVGVDGRDLYIDPYHGGRTLDAAGCARLVSEVLGTEHRFDPAWLEPASPRSTLARMLANLRRVYLAANDVDGATWVLRLRTMLPQSPPEEQAQLAALLAGRGEARAAARELERMAERVDGPRAERARQRAALLRASLN